MKWIKATPKDFDGGLSHKFFRDTKTKENLSAGAAFSFFKRNCIDLVEILDESAPVPDKVDDLALEAMDFYWRALVEKLNNKDLGDIERRNYERLTEMLHKIISKPNWQSTQSDAGKQSGEHPTTTHLNHY